MSSNPFQVEDLLVHQGFLRALARELVRDEARAEDVVQDAYVAALERPPRSGAALRVWLATVVRNLALNVRRGDSRRGIREQAVARREAVPSHEVVADRLEVSRRLIEAVQALAEPYRSTLYLRFYEGLGQGAIARRQEVSTDTVKTRLRRGLARLRASLDADQERSLWTASFLPLAAGRGGGLMGGVSKATSIAGGILGMKKLMWVAATLFVLIVGWGILRNPDVEPTETSTSVSAAIMAEPALVPESAEPAERMPTERAVVASAPVAPSGAESTSSLTLRVLWEEDRTPAENVELLAFATGPREGRDVRRAVSDVAGRVRLLDLPPGSVTVQAYRGGTQYYRVAVGGEEVEFLVPRGVDVTGTVVDPAGRPVAEAEIWLSRRPVGWVGARLAAHTDEYGRFNLRCLQEDRAISARASGFGPSIREPLSTRRVSPDETVELRLELGDAGGGLEGYVVDPNGRRVSGVWVAVGSEAAHARNRNGNWSRLAPPVLARTDSDGRFRVEGLSIGPRIEVQAMAAGFPPAETGVEIRAGETSEVVVQLEYGAVVEGFARDAAGQPLPGVWVQLVDRWSLPGRFFPEPSAVTAGDGTYRLGPLPVGELKLNARSLERDDLGQAEIQISAGPGRSYSWDPILAATFEISGRLVDEDGLPLDGWGVSLIAEETGMLATNARGTDTEGGFQFFAPAGAYTLSVWEGEPEFARTVRKGVTAGTTGLTLVVETGMRDQATVVGRFDDAGGRIEAQDRVQVLLMSTERSVTSGELVEGGFQLGPVEPGTYRVAVRAGERIVLSTFTFDLKAGEEHDVGLLATEHPGSVRIDFTVEAGIHPQLVQLMAADYERWYHHPLMLEGDSYVGTGLPPGTYELMVFGSLVATFNAPLEVRAGEEAVAEIHLQRGAYRMFRIKVPQGAEPWARVTYSVTDARGDQIFSLTAPRIGVEQNDIPFGFGFLLGRHELRVELDNGLSVTHAVDIQEIETLLDPIKLELR